MAMSSVAPPSIYTTLAMGSDLLVQKRITTNTNHSGTASGRANFELTQSFPVINIFRPEAAATSLTVKMLFIKMKPFLPSTMSLTSDQQYGSSLGSQISPVNTLRALCTIWAVYQPESAPARRIRTCPVCFLNAAALVKLFEYAPADCTAPIDN
jgi:hypothetical protein